MSAKQGITFQQIMKDLKARKFAPIYILMGDESYYIDKISDYIAENALKPEERDFNQTICFGSDVTAVQVTDMARRYPMMAERQVIIVKEAQNVRNLDALEKYIKKPVTTTILVWCYKNGKIDGRKKIISLASAVGVVFESRKVYDSQLPGFISSYLKSRKATIDPKACQMMADHIGSDLNRLTSELDKVLISLPDDNRMVTPEIVEREIGVSKDFNLFEFKSAIATKNVFKANQIIKYFNSNPKVASIYILLPYLFKFFQNLMIVHYSPRKSNERDIAAALDMKSTWAARDFVYAVRNYSARKTMNIIDKIREIDERSKGIDNPNTSAGELLKELVFFIMH